MNSSPKNISINDFDYDLPNERIALFPLENRDQSKLLIFKNEQISEDCFENILTHIPKESLLVFNNSKVINARIVFEKSTGSKIEIFCLEPAGDTHEYASVMAEKGSSIWKCFIGGVSKWKTEYLEKVVNINDKEIVFKAKIISNLSEGFVVKFEWNDASISFAEILDKTGDVPLPPYIKRSTELADTSRYQTVYAQHDGSVAAPTAGLHFTEQILAQLNQHQIYQAFVTLHVGAGTFKPVKSETMQEHEMHSEWIDVDINSIQNIADQKELIIAVGTTSLRTLESLYWLGVKSLLNPDIEILDIQQWDAYELSANEISKEAALTALMVWMHKKGVNRIFTTTQLLITPGYSFKIVKAMVTNFHQPKSTLLLLVAAAIGTKWKACYEYALENDFRFLSYGDANLLFMAES
ncbi:MAG: S-adenosylmethionine:tRNA ribosyltransferase-isomerase [Sphingobacteriales bacterium]|nr:S-adenosylmethionine:tRNA ribosyltransferase-isomerase [Sphingobacteriales bacterium]